MKLKQYKNEKIQELIPWNTKTLGRQRTFNQMKVRSNQNKKIRDERGNIDDNWHQNIQNRIRENFNNLYSIKFGNLIKTNEFEKL